MADPGPDSRHGQVVARSSIPSSAPRSSASPRPRGRGIAWEGTEIWAYRDRPAQYFGVLAANVARWPDREAYVFHPGGQRMTWREVGRAGRSRRRAASAGLWPSKGRPAVPADAGLPGIRHQLSRDHSARRRRRAGQSRAHRGGVGGADQQGRRQGAGGLARRLDTASSKSVRGRPRQRAGGVRDRRASAAGNACLFCAELNARRRTAPVHEAVDEWDLCAISFTSGTTGVPKGTMAMHINALGCAQNVVHRGQGAGRRRRQLVHAAAVSQHRRLRGLPARAAEWREMRDHERPSRRWTRSS